MAQVRIIAIGKMRESFLAQAQAEYVKRLKPYMKLELKEIPDLPAPEGISAASADQIREREAEGIIKLLGPKDYLVTLDQGGEQFSSEELAHFLQEREMNADNVVLVIGGSLGLSRELVGKARLRWSFSRLTFPHQLFRVMLLEQIYRACKINRGEPYHK
jgi:23S rRNA (pseudouridine1915-N3)-methyltransferase